MNEDIAKFEAELKRLQPMRPGARVEEAVAAALEGRQVSSADPLGAGGESPATGLRSWRRAWWVAAATVPIAAAVVAGMVLFSARRTEPLARSQSATATDVFKPIAARDVLYAAADEGLVTLDDGVPARKQRLQYVGTITWRDPKTKASLTWTVPREEVRYVPIRYQ